jgi:hypothetical protein
MLKDALSAFDSGTIRLSKTAQNSIPACSEPATFEKRWAIHEKLSSEPTP